MPAGLATYIIRRLLSVVEKMIDDPETLIRRVKRAHDRTRRAKGEHDEAYEQKVAARIISSYSTKSAIAGGLTALPAVLPGAGTLITVLGGALADVALVLKFEVEMATCLTHLYGFDIHTEKERKLAFLLAAVSTYEAKTGRSFQDDVAAAQGAALWNYGPREVGKLLLAVLSMLAVRAISKGLSRAVPFVGVVIGGSVNKVMTTRVGRRCAEELARRKRLLQGTGKVVEVEGG